MKSAHKVIIDVPEMSLHEAQRAIMEDEHRYKVMSCGRRFGKTTLAVEWLSFSDQGAVDGYPVGYFTATYKLIEDVWLDITNTLSPIIKKSNKNEGRIQLLNGGIIDFWTLQDKQAGRGRKYRKIVIDEAAHATYLEEAWERAIEPTLTDFKGDAWFISTPKGINYFYTLFKRGLEGREGWKSYQLPTTANPFIDPEEINKKRNDLPELVFKQEYLAEFVTFGAGLVKPEYLIEGVPNRELPVIIAVDLAISEKQTADFSVILAMSRDPVTGFVYIREVERFRGQFNEILQRVVAAALRNKASLISVEQTQFQAAVVQELTRTTALPVRGVRPDKDKLTRFMPILTRFEQFMVRYDPSRVPRWYLDELLAFPEGEHDDGVDATSIAFNSLPMIEFKPIDYSLTVHTSA